MLNFVASFAFYGSFAMYALAGLILGLSVKWIVEAYLLNRRAHQQAQRYQSYCQSSERASFKASRYAK